MPGTTFPGAHSRYPAEGSLAEENAPVMGTGSRLRTPRTCSATSSSPVSSQCLCRGVAASRDGTVVGDVREADEWRQPQPACHRIPTDGEARSAGGAYKQVFRSPAGGSSSRKRSRFLERTGVIQVAEAARLSTPLISWRRNVIDRCGTSTSWPRRRRGCVTTETHAHHWFGPTPITTASRTRCRHV